VTIGHDQVTSDRGHCSSLVTGHLVAKNDNQKNKSTLGRTLHKLCSLFAPYSLTGRLYLLFFNYISYNGVNLSLQIEQLKISIENHFDRLFH
jgi:hypothetical protein